MRSVALTLLICCCAAPCLAQVVPPAVESVTLGNGLRVLLAPDTLAATVDVAVWYGAGARTEQPGSSGLTHLMERLMFRGSQRYPAGEHQRLLRAEGASLNTFTTSDVSCFYETLPASALGLALDLEADRMGALRITAESVERDRRIARAEMGRLNAGNPVGLGLQLLYATAFPGHPYGAPVIGRERDLDRMTLAVCQAYDRERYAPNNAVLTLVGRFDRAEALRLVRGAFGPLPRREAPRDPTAAPPAQPAERRASVRGGTPVPVVLVGWRAPGGRDSSSAALDLLARLMSTGQAGRLQRALLGSAGLGLVVEGGFDARRDASLLFAAAALRPDADSAAVESTLVSVSAALSAAPVDAADLERVKREAELSLMLDWESPRGRAQSIGEAEAVLGDWRMAARRLERIRALTPEQVQRVAASVLVPARRTVVWMLPGQVPAAPPAARPRPKRSPTEREVAR